MDCYENIFESETNIKNPNIPSKYWKHSDVWKNNINNLSWNRHMKKHKTIGDSTDKKWNVIYWLSFLAILLFSYLIQNSL